MSHHVLQWLLVLLNTFHKKAYHLGEWAVLAISPDLIHPPARGHTALR